MSNHSLGFAISAFGRNWKFSNLSPLDFQYSDPVSDFILVINDALYDEYAVLKILTSELRLKTII